MGSNVQPELYDNIKKMIIKAARLKIRPENIDTSRSLFGAGGIGLDSLDALELVVALEKDFGVRIPDADVGAKVLISVETIAKFIEENGSGRSNP
jgi:acyl carrier protein